MSFYFIQKTRTLTKATISRHQKQNKWSIKWAFRKSMSSSISNNKSISATTTTTTAQTKIENLSELEKFSKTTLATIGGPETKINTTGHDQQQQQRKKGKFSKLSKKFQSNYWNWKTGAGGWTILSILDWWLLATGGWFSWSGLLMRWTPISITLYAALEWHYHNQKLQREGLPRTASKLQANVYCSLPLRLISRCWGWLASCNVPETLRPIVYGLYSKSFNVNLDEAAIVELRNYRSLSEFFTRPLKDGVRVIDDSHIVSPADGKVLHFGLTTNLLIEQVKGVTYSLDAFLGPDSWVESKSSTYLENIKHDKHNKTSLYQCIIYLAPGDYHRFHSPAEWEPNLRRHFTGELLSVSPKIATWLPGLFCLNERATYIGKWKYGFFSFTAVGATNVGSVQINFDEKLKTNQWLGINLGCLNNGFDEMKIANKIHLQKGELVGQFNMGSTIVLIFEAPINFRFTLEPGQKIKVGQSLGTV